MRYMRERRRVRRRRSPRARCRFPPRAPRSHSRSSATSPGAASSSSARGRSASSRPGVSERAEAIVAEEAERFRGWQASLEVVPTIASLRARAEAIRSAELAKAKLSERERAAVESITSQIVNKLLHLPTVRMKEAAAAPDAVLYADAVRHLFGLEEDR